MVFGARYRISSIPSNRAAEYKLVSVIWAFVANSGTAEMGWKPALQIEHTE